MFCLNNYTVAHQNNSSMQPQITGSYMLMDNGQVSDLLDRSVQWQFVLHHTFSTNKYGKIIKRSFLLNTKTH